MSRKKKQKEFVVGYWGEVGTEMIFVGPFESDLEGYEWSRWSSVGHEGFDGFITVKPPKGLRGVIN